jgi:hypothetical protein
MAASGANIAAFKNAAKAPAEAAEAPKTGKAEGTTNKAADVKNVAEAKQKQVKEQVALNAAGVQNASKNLEQINQKQEQAHPATLQHMPGESPQAYQRRLEQYRNQQIRNRKVQLLKSNPSTRYHVNPYTKDSLAGHGDFGVGSDRQSGLRREYSPQGKGVAGRFQAEAGLRPLEVEGAPYNPREYGKTHRLLAKSIVAFMNFLPGWSKSLNLFAYLKFLLELAKRFGKNMAKRILGLLEDDAEQEGGSSERDDREAANEIPEDWLRQLHENVYEAQVAGNRTFRMVSARQAIFSGVRV